MRILQVIHQFPPYSSQGSEVYCYQLAKYLNSIDEVAVFHISNTSPRHPKRFIQENYDGIATFHCVDGGEYARCADWSNQFLRQQFQFVLNSYQPQIVHFHNYLSLGDDLVSMARASGAVVVYTLHDYGLICPNNLLLRSDGGLCGKQDSEFFQDCCPLLIRTFNKRVYAISPYLPSLAKWRQFTNQYPNALVRKILAGFVSLAERYVGLPVQTEIAVKREFYFKQTRRIFHDADLFLSPSAFLRQKYIDCGLAPEKIAYVRNGMRLFQTPPYLKSTDRIQFGYIGGLHTHKGIELLLNAFEGLGDRADLHIYGSTFGSPISERYWQRISSQPAIGVVAHGVYQNTQIGEILATLDVVIVPSLWFENSPLTIQEAFIGGVPVITANQGGMAELVRDGVDGLHFCLGDEQDLRSKLLSLIENPNLLMSLRENIPTVPTIEQQAAVVRQHYEQLLSS